MIKRKYIILLVVARILVLGYSGINFKTPGQPVDFLGMHFQISVNHFIPPAVGTIALIEGLLLLVTNPGGPDGPQRK